MLEPISRRILSATGRNWSGIFVRVLFQDPNCRFSQVRGIAAGLEFLHANNIIHGDLKVVRAQFTDLLACSDNPMSLRSKMFWLTNRARPEYVISVFPR
jgi:serine/threonine protein kinase